MRLSAPELAARYRDGLIAEGAHVVDAGMVGTEMLYWLVGSRDLDGGLMCTASHNPKAYTGAKMVERGSVALSGDRGLQRGARAHRGTGSARPPAAARTRRSTSTRTSSARALGIIDPAAVRPLKVVVDGGNGMAGPMVGPILEQLPLELVTTYWVPDGEFPDHEPNPLLPENREFVIRKVRESGADLGIAWDGDADRCFFIDGDGGFVAGDFLTALLAASVLEKAPGRGHPLRRARLPRGAGHRRPARRPRAGQPRRPRVLQDPHARRGRRVRRRGVRPLLLQGVLQRRLGHDPGAADPRAALQAGQDADRAGRPLRSTYFISGEINSTVEDQRAKIDEIRARYADAEITELDGVSVDYDDWHFNVRPSNTEPLLRLNLESLVSEADMERRRDEVLELIRS